MDSLHLCSFSMVLCMTPNKPKSHNKFINNCNREDEGGLFIFNLQVVPTIVNSGSVGVAGSMPALNVGQAASRILQCPPNPRGVQCWSLLHPRPMDLFGS